tara:strand:+ start:111 stop:1190 length:1080 start_codon:yes stop_codon:yes gene_type:complete
MKKVKKLILLPLVLFMFSCDKEFENTPNVVGIDPPTEPVFRSETPMFPVSSMHIIQREYVNLTSNQERSTTATSSDEYIEQRLIELYPELAYEGIINDSKQELEKFEDEYSQYLIELNNYYLSIGADSLIEEEQDYREFTSVEDEIEFMQMTEAEIEEFLQLENFAKSKKLVNREQLDDLMFSSALPNDNVVQQKSGTLLIGTLIVAAIGYPFSRIIQSRNRAESKTIEFFENNKEAGQKGDAFRHIYVSMLLRRYITRAGSSIVMSGYEVLSPNPNARDTYMDLHNNKVGRHTKYWTFRGKYFKDRYKWELWASRAKNWVNSSSNAVLKSDWYDSNPNKADAKREEALVSDYKYIYYY